MALQAKIGSVNEMRRHLEKIRVAYRRELERERTARTDVAGAAASRRAWALRSEYETQAAWIERDGGGKVESLPLV